MSNIETIEILDRTVVNLFEWSTSVFGPAWGTLVWLILLGFVLSIIIPKLTYRIHGGGGQ